MENNALILFAQNPVKGKVKTRLAKFIGSGEALKYYRTLLQSTVEQTSKVPFRRFVFLTDDTDNSIFGNNHTCLLQQGKDPGERIGNAFKNVFSEGFDKVCVIGPDCPALTSEIIRKAFDTLGNNDYVIGPAKNGGCYLIGMRQANSELVENISLGSAEALKNTVEKINSEKKKYALLDELCGVDTIEDFIECTGFERMPGPRNGFRYTVKLHDSLKRHYDFRMEWNGVLLSWFSGSPPSLDPSAPAVMTITSLHKTKYIYSENNRPYFLKGPGPSIVIDKGTYTPLNGNISVSSLIESDRSIKKGIECGLLEIYLDGANLKGKFSLCRHGNGDTWILQKLEDEFVSGFSLGEISRSVITGRTIDDVRNGIKSSPSDVSQESLFSNTDIS